LNCVFITVENHGPLSLREVGQRLGISHVAVQQIEKKALSKMKKVLFKNQIEKQRAFSKEEHYLNVKF
jgi:DNA-directed RNA polymerase specialized sigma subunit